MGMQTVSLEEFKFDDEVLAKISETMAQLYRVVPLKFERQCVDRCDLRSAEPDDSR